MTLEELGIAYSRILKNSKECVVYSTLEALRSGPTYASYRKRRGSNAFPLRVSVPAWEPTGPFDTESFKERLLSLLPGMHFYQAGNELVGELEGEGVIIQATVTTYGVSIGVEGDGFYAGFLDEKLLSSVDAAIEKVDMELRAIRAKTAWALETLRGLSAKE